MDLHSVDDVKKILGLTPHPREGGWFRRTYESPEFMTTGGSGEDGARRTCTAIYYLLEPDTFSEMHCLASDEIFHHYMGGAVEMLQLLPDGKSETVVIGGDLVAGQRPQVVVPRGVWQGSRLMRPEGFALLGCTVSPGFEYADYETMAREDLIERWPGKAEGIKRLTRG